jgi:triosephosphate isomerase (TIM)
MRKKLVIGNWKMNGSMASNLELLRAMKHAAASPVSVAVCAPFPYLEQCRQLLRNTWISWGAQDCSAHVGGAYTGEVSATMLKEFECRYVIVGHSERRAYHGETSAQVAAKARAAVAAGITPVVCVGETLTEREAGTTLSVVGLQLQAAIDSLGAELNRIVLAYEPVWAIGTGKTATPDQAQQVHAALRLQLERAGAPEVQILYGGSVKGDNAAELFGQADIDGGLVGGASLKADEFLKICGV